MGVEAGGERKVGGCVGDMSYWNYYDEEIFWSSMNQSNFIS